MKAAVIREFGDVDVLKFEEVETPTAGPGNVLVKVLASGINRIDHYIREGSVAPELSFPHILGADASGEVVELGEGVTGFAVGERVVPSPGFPTNEEDQGVRPVATAPSFTLQGLGIPGTYAQYIEVPAAWLVKDTTGRPPEEVATLPIVLGTAVRAVKVLGEVKAGDRVLIHAGGSGSGSMQIQVAKALGAQVATTVRREAKCEFVRSLGADLVINTRQEDFVEAIKNWTTGRGADVVVDNLGGDTLAQSLAATRSLGTVIAFGFTAGTEVTFDIRDFFFGQKRLIGSMGSEVEDLEWGLEQIRAGRIRPSLDRALPLSEAAEAHRLIATNHVSGNLVLLPWAA